MLVPITCCAHASCSPLRALGAQTAGHRRMILRAARGRHIIASDKLQLQGCQCQSLQTQFLS